MSIKKRVELYRRNIRDVSESSGVVFSGMYSEPTYVVRVPVSLRSAFEDFLFYYAVSGGVKRKYYRDYMLAVPDPDNVIIASQLRELPLFKSFLEGEN
jgi:hypothetical protein